MQFFKFARFMIRFQKIQVSSQLKVAYAEVDYSQKKELFDFLQKNKIDLSELYAIKNDARRIEWMTIRGILIEFLPQFCDIEYDEHRKPHLTQCHHHLSISHSHHMVAIAIDQKEACGIDIQHLTPKIDHIKEKFLNPSELETCEQADEVLLTLYWSVKEALFKVYGKKNIFLKDNIAVEKLNFNGKEGTAIGQIQANGHQSRHKLELKLVNDYILAYVVNS